MTEKPNSIDGDGRERPETDAMQMAEQVRSQRGSSDQVAWPWPPSVLAQLGQTLLSANTMEGVLEACAHVISPTDINGATILLAGGSHDDRYARVAAAWAQNDQPILPVGAHFDIQEHLLQTLWTSSQPVVVNEVAIEEQISNYLRSMLLQAHTQALVALPLRSEGTDFGAVIIGRSEPTPFDPTSIHIYEAVFVIATGAIRKFWVIQEAQQALSKTRALYEISRRLLKCQSLDDILLTVLDSELFGAAGGSIALLEPSGAASGLPGSPLNPAQARRSGGAGGSLQVLADIYQGGQADPELVFWAAEGINAERILGMRMPVSEGIIGWVVRENEPALVPDAYADERFYSRVDQETDFRTHSILCAPLRADEGVIGAIELVDVRQEYLSQEGIALLEQVADQAALLIENQRLLNETQRQAHELSMLLEVSHNLTSILEREEALQLISSRVLDLIKADGCHVFLLQSDPDGEDLLIPVASSDRYSKQILSTPLKMGQGVTGRVAESGIGVIVNRVDLDPRGFPVPGTPREPESLVSVPLISEGRRIGVMTVSRRGEEEFVARDMSIAAIMAGQAATVLEKARLFNEAQQRSQELGALNAVASTASQSLTLEEILNATLERVTEVMQGSTGLICLLDKPRDNMQLAAQRNMPAQLVQRFQQYGMHNTLCQLTAEMGRTYYVPDLSQQPGRQQLPSVETATLVNNRLYAYLGTPLVAHGQVLGTLSVFNTEPNTFTSADADLLTAIGQQVGIAVRNAQLYQQTERALEESTALYDASQAISSTLELDEALQVAIIRLTEYIGADQGQVVLFYPGERDAGIPGKPPARRPQRHVSSSALAGNVRTPSVSGSQRAGASDANGNASTEASGYGLIMAEYIPTSGIQALRIPLEGNLAYEFLRDKGQALCIDDVHSHPVTAKGSQIPVDDDVKSMLFVPLILQGRLIGAVVLYFSQTHRTFTQAELSFCRTLADRAALAIENRRLFSQTLFTLQETSLLYKASQALTRAHDLRDVLRAVTDNLPIKQIDQAWIALIDRDLVSDNDPGKRAVEIMSMWDHEGDTHLLHKRFNARDLPITAQPDATQLWVINDLDNETALDAQSIATLKKLGIKSALIVPLITGETLLGWLLLITHHYTHVFDLDQTRPYQALADQAAVVIQNQQLLQQVQSSLKEVQNTHRQYLREEWMSFLRSQEEDLKAVAYNEGSLQTAADPGRLPIEEAISQSGPVALHGSLVTPLKVRGQVIGALGLEDPEQAREWTGDEVSIVQEIADRVAQAVENARLLEATQISLAETERLYRATSRLASVESAAGVIKVLAEEIDSALGSTYSGIILCTGPDPASRVDWLEVSARWNLQGMTYPPGTRFSTSDYPAFSRLLEQRDSMVTSDTDAHLPLLSPYREGSKGASGTTFTIPLVAGKSWLGMVNIVSQNEKMPNARAMRFLESLADRAAVTLESARLYGETQKRAIQLEAAAEVSRAATSTLEQENLLAQVVDLIRERFKAYQVQVFLLDPTERWAVLEASTGETGQGLLKRGHALEVGGDTLIGYVTKIGQPRTTGDALQPLLEHAQDQDASGSELAIPLKIGGRVIGALDVKSTTLAAFGPDDIAVLSTLADQLATAIDNARLYQEQLQTAEKLREIDRLKSQFLANMSHELRTPLNSIIGFSRVMLKGIDGPLTENQKQDLTAIHDSGQLLLKLITDVLDLSKIEAGKMELAFEETDLYEVIDGVLTTGAALFKDKPHIELRRNIATDLPSIIADGTRLRQVILNLLSNAAKFTEKGRVELNITHDDRFVTIQVSDTGIGIPSDKIDVIFQEFEQVDGSTTRTAGGTGLGLPISRHFVELHGGRIWVESEVAVGSTFTAQFPIKGPQASGGDEGEVALASSQRLILAIDDDADVISLYKRYLERRNYQVVGLSSSERVVQTARKLGPYAILLDLLIPKKDGWAVIQELKTDPQTRDIPIVLCSIVSAAGRGFSLGAADYLVKPITEDQLLTALARLEDRTEHPRAARRVLIIDDSPEDRRLLRRVLQTANEPYQVVEAHGGREGIEAIQREQPDLVVLDLMMPDMDGIAVLESLKRDQETRQIPIIIVTAKELTAQERTLINGQVAALFRKGLFTADELLQDLNEALDRVRRSVPASGTQAYSTSHLHGAADAVQVGTKGAPEE
jgi:GAF domain-containing protein/DNA-binding response OmpR family regulator